MPARSANSRCARLCRVRSAYNSSASSLASVASSTAASHPSVAPKRRSIIAAPSFRLLLGFAASHGLPRGNGPVRSLASSTFLLRTDRRHPRRRLIGLCRLGRRGSERLCMSTLEVRTLLRSHSATSTAPAYLRSRAVTSKGGDNSTIAAAAELAAITRIPINSSEFSVDSAGRP